MSKEIRNELKKLSRPEKVIIGKMMSYLYTKSINQFELKSMHAEIVGMAAEGALRGDTLENICGPDYKKFCDDLSANCLHKSKTEIVLEALMILSATLAILVPFMFLVEILFENPGKLSSLIISMDASKLFGMSLVPAFCGGLGALYYQRNVFARKGKALLLYSLFYLVIYFVLRVISDVFFHGEISINLIFMAITTVAVLLFCFSVKRAVAAARMRGKEQ